MGYSKAKLLDSIKKILQTNNYTLTSVDKDSLSKLFEGTDYKILDIISRLMPFCNQYTDQQDPQKLLELFYEFTLSQSFPHTTERNFSRKEIKLTKAFSKILGKVSKFEFNNNIDNLTGLFNLDTRDNFDEKEYLHFKRVFKEKNVYSMIQLNRELTGFNTIDHITGVHNLAMHIAKQLHKKDTKIELGKISGAALGHDIGKYGCIGEDSKRVPYFHYYYTDVWFKENNLLHMGHIATNHSTWDLEIENLSLESLILIYCDFRVKNTKVDGKYVMTIMDLKQSFKTILDKLDNVDDLKEKRYRKVYEKLKDFEAFMTDLGVSTTIDIKPIEPNEKHYTLMHPDEIIANIKHLAIKHNTELMYRLRSADSLGAILSTVKNESSDNIRTYLDILEEYSTYFSQVQKKLTLDFCFNFLTHKEVDIRNHSAIIIGKLLAYYDEDYRKELPTNALLDLKDRSSDLLDNYINRILYPDYNTTDQHKEYLVYALKIMVESLFSHSHLDDQTFIEYDKVLLKYYNKIYEFDFYSQFSLVLTVKYVKSINLDDSAFTIMFNFLKEMMVHDNYEVRVATLERVRFLLLKLNEGSEFTLNTAKLIEDFRFSNGVAELYLKYKIALSLNLDLSLIKRYKDVLVMASEDVSEIFLDNLKSATSWIVKKVNIEFLREQKNSSNAHLLHTSLHLCNLLKVSANENVRNVAGKSLLDIIPRLKYDARNDVAIELLRALEIQDFNITKYIPKYLGQVILHLRPQELEEVINDFINKIKVANSQLGTLILESAATALQNYHIYKNLVDEDEVIYENRKRLLTKVLLNGVSSYNDRIKQSAFAGIGHHIFGSDIDLHSKCDIFKLISKKLLVDLSQPDNDFLLFLNKSSALINIYRFISDYTFSYGEIELETPKRIAFFPGSFDPFTLGHKKIVRQIQKLGFEVFLAIDEYSWSKNTQPHNIRRMIAKLSIASELNVHLFPSGVQINISNDEDIKTLKNSFKDSEVFLVVGSDVILNASSYRNTDKEVLNINHIILERNKASRTNEQLKIYNQVINAINGEILHLNLPNKYIDVSSTRIRKSIDEDNDFTDLIDSSAQKYIYQNSLYRKESVLKKITQTKDINIEVIDLNKEIIDRLDKQYDDINFRKIRKLKNEESPRVLILENIQTHEIIGFSIFHWIRQNSLYSLFNDDSLTEYIRNKASGRIIAIDGIFTNGSFSEINLEQIVLSQTLSFAISRDYNYCVYKSIEPSYHTSSIAETLTLQGFESTHLDACIFCVSIDRPITLFFDVFKYIKEPFISDEKVIKSIKTNRKRLQLALTKLYPGELVLPFDSAMIYHSLVKKICEANNVPSTPTTPRQLGELMCVPFGSILEGEVIPNTVTKSIHTDKIFDNDGTNYHIGPYPNYMSLENQVRMIKSFDRDVILIDDLLSKGYRFKPLDPILKEQGVNVERTIVGLLSGRGMELMGRQNRKVEYVHFIPNLKIWFNESDLYPFIGGHTVDRKMNKNISILKSNNFVLPYNYPKFIKNSPHDAVYSLSKVAIENALDILSTLESSYQKVYNKALSISQLRDVFTAPRIPDRGKSIDYDMTMKPSSYLKNDLIQLNKITRDV